MLETQKVDNKKIYTKRFL